MTYMANRAITKIIIFLWLSLKFRVGRVIIVLADFQQLLHYIL